jgi:hypothetical protein
MMYENIEVGTESQVEGYAIKAIRNAYLEVTHETAACGGRHSGGACRKMKG